MKSIVSYVKKGRESIKHYLNVRSWKKEINKKAKVVAKKYGYKKNSYEYQLLLNHIANSD